MRGFYFSLIVLIFLTWMSHLVTIPPWQNPDEPTHFEYVKILVDRKTFSLTQPDLPTQQAIIQSMDRHLYWKHVQVPPPDPLPGSFRETPFLNLSSSQMGFTPPLYYLLVAGILSPARERSLEAQFYLARGLSVCLGLFTLLLSYLIAKELFWDRPKLIPAVVAFIGLLPQFNLVTTSVNPDNLANLPVTGVIYLLVRMFKEGISPLGLTLIVSGILLGLMTKRTTFMALPLTTLALFLLTWSRLKGRGFRIWAISLYKAMNALLLLLGIYALLTWYFPETVQTILRRIIPEIYQGPLYFSQILSPSSASRVEEVGLHLFRSFWYTFGWMKYPLSDPWYQGLQVICILALTGLILFWFRLARRKAWIEAWRVRGILILIFSCLLAFLSVFLDSQGFTLFTQGRYLFPAISAFAVLGALGLYQLVPKKLHGPFTAVLILGLLAFNVLTFWKYTVPAFHDFPSRVISHQLAFNQAVGEIYGDKKVGQTFLAEAGGLSGIDLFLATYARTNTHPLIFHLKEKPDSATDLFTQTLSARWMGNNAYYRFRFPIIPDSLGKSYYFYLESPESQPGNAITLWYHSEGSYKSGSLFINGEEEKGDLTFKTVYESSLRAFLEGLTRNKPFPLSSPGLYVGLLAFYGLNVGFLVISLRVFFTFKG